MSTTAPAAPAKPGLLKGWMKAVLGTIGGLVGGAIMMQLNPFIDRVVKPAKPVANFAVEKDGLNVTFLNRSSNGSQGRWDFGDGSPLEFVKADEPSVTHTYAKPGNYVVKFALANVLGEENERTVTVELGAAPKTVAAEKPQVVDLYVKPPGNAGQPVYAPATFQFQATVDNAQQLIWDFGDGQGPQPAEHQVTHTFSTPGTYTIKLAAFNGKESDREEATVEVQPPPAGALNLTLRIVDEGLLVETNRRKEKASKAVRVTKKGPESIEMTIPAATGFEIVSVEKKGSNNENVEKTEWKVAQDKLSVRVVAKVNKTNGTIDAVLNEQVQIVEQRRQKQQRPPATVSSAVATNGATVVQLPPLPVDWTEVKRTLTYELRDGERVVWQGSQAPQNVAMQMRGQKYVLSANVAMDRITMQVTPGK